MSIWRILGIILYWIILIVYSIFLGGMFWASAGKGAESIMILPLVAPEMFLLAMMGDVHAKSVNN